MWQQLSVTTCVLVMISRTETKVLKLQEYDEENGTTKWGLADVAANKIGTEPEQVFSKGGAGKRGGGGGLHET